MISYVFHMSEIVVTIFTNSEFKGLRGDYIFV